MSYKTPKVLYESISDCCYSNFLAVLVLKKTTLKTIKAKFYLTFYN